MEKGNLREGLKSIDNPIFEVISAKVNSLNLLCVVFCSYDYIIEQNEVKIFFYNNELQTDR